MSDGKEIYELLPKITGEVGAVGKDGRNTQQGAGYRFRKIDDVMGALQPLFAKYRVTCYPRVVKMEQEQVAVGSKGTRMFHVTSWIEYHFCAPDGSEIVATTLGEATDSGDKACNKAMAAAMKYALTQTFSIPTEEAKDTENDSPELSAHQGDHGEPPASGPLPDVDMASLKSKDGVKWLRGFKTTKGALEAMARIRTVTQEAHAFVVETLEMEPAQ